MNDNQELLDWAVENITEWGDDYTHLRSDVNGVFFSFADWELSETCSWIVTHALVRLSVLTSVDFFTKTPQVVTKMEWLEAKEALNQKSHEKNDNSEIGNSELLDVFTKGMLVEGKHIVVTRDGDYMRLSWDNLHSLEDYGNCLALLSFSEDLTHKKQDSCSVDKVYALVWDREQSEKKKGRKQLEDEIKNLEQELVRKRKELGGIDL